MEKSCNLCGSLCSGHFNWDFLAPRARPLSSALQAQTQAERHSAPVRSKLRPPPCESIIGHARLPSFGQLRRVRWPPVIRWVHCCALFAPLAAEPKLGGACRGRRVGEPRWAELANSCVVPPLHLRRPCVTSWQSARWQRRPQRQRQRRQRQRRPQPIDQSAAASESDGSAQRESRAPPHSARLVNWAKRRLNCGPHLGKHRRRRRRRDSSTVRAHWQAKCRLGRRKFVPIAILNWGWLGGKVASLQKLATLNQQTTSQIDVARLK